MSTIPWQRAIKLIFEEKAVSIKDSDELLRSQSTSILVPEIIMLNNFENRGDKFINREFKQRVDKNGRLMPLPSKLVHERDSWVCAYCGEFGNTIDHIVPKSFGGTEKWDNVITACFDCNNKKDNMFLSELGWEMLYEPSPLHGRTKLTKEQKFVDSYLKSFNQDIKQEAMQLSDIY